MNEVLQGGARLGGKSAAQRAMEREARKPNYVGVNVTLNQEPSLVDQVQYNDLVKQGRLGLRRFLLTHYLVQVPEMDQWGRAIRPPRMRMTWVPRSWNRPDGEHPMPGDRALLGLSAQGGKR